MLTERFSRLFSRLLTRWISYQDAPRDADRVTELGASRMALDEVRTEIAEERASMSLPAAMATETLRVAISETDLSRLRVAAIGLDSNA